MNSLNDFLRDIQYNSRHPILKLGIRSFVVLSATVFVLIAYWMPLHRNNTSLSQNILDNRRLIVEMEQQEELIQLYNSAVQTVPVIEKKMRVTVTKGQLIDELSSLAQKSHVKIVSESYDKDRADTDEYYSQADLVIQGSYPSIRTFIQGLSELPMWLEIQEVRFSSERNGTSIKCSLTIAGNINGMRNGSK